MATGTAATTGGRKKAAAAAAALSPDRPLDLSKVRRGYHNAQREYDYWVPSVDIEGEIPRALHGTLYRNGPGLVEVYGTKLLHRECPARTTLNKLVNPSIKFLMMHTAKLAYIKG